MYIVELFFKLRDDYKNKKGVFAPKKMVVKAKKEEEPCSHIFVPIDSTKQILGCSKCGLVVKREDIPKMPNNGNFFIKEI
jgi:hypothetical protein